MSRLLRAGLLAPWIAALGLALPQPAGAELSCNTLPEFARLFLRGHVRHNDLDTEVRRRASVTMPLGPIAVISRTSS